MDWDKLRVFHAVAQAGSFTHAGEELSLSQSAVSRQISALEEDLGVQLFHRHARGLILTEQGDLLYRAAHEVAGRLALAKAMVADSKVKPSGELRITTTVGFGSTWLTPRIREFIELYPEISVSLIFDDRGELDLAMREADVAVRFSEPQQPDLIKRRLFTVHSHVYASPEYLKRRRAPKSIEDLSRHPVIVYGEEAPPALKHVNWLLTLPRLNAPLKPVLQVNNIYALLLAVESGLGIAALPDYMARDNGRVVQVLPEVEGPSTNTYFVYPEELRNSKRIQVFRDFLIRRVQEWTF